MVESDTVASEMHVTPNTSPPLTASWPCTKIIHCCNYITGISNELPFM